MTQAEYILLKLAFTEYGQITLLEFIQQWEKNNDKLKSETTKALSKDYVTLVKKFLDEINKEQPDIAIVKAHIAKLGCQHYKMYLSLKE